MPDTDEPIDVNEPEIQFLIWSNEHGRWWGHDDRGYTGLIEEAGRYSITDAVRICRQVSVDGKLKLTLASHLTGQRIDVLPEHVVPAPLTLHYTAIDSIVSMEDTR